MTCQLTRQDGEHRQNACFEDVAAPLVEIELAGRQGQDLCADGPRNDVQGDVRKSHRRALRSGRRVSASEAFSTREATVEFDVPEHA